MSMSTKIASILEDMGVDYSDDMMSELVKDISVDSRVDLFSKDDERKSELLKFIKEVPPFLLVEYPITRHAVYTQNKDKMPDKLEKKKSYRKQDKNSQYRSFVNDPVQRIHYYKSLWAKDKVVTSMGKIVKEDFKVLYK